VPAEGPPWLITISGARSSSGAWKFWFFWLADFKKTNIETIGDLGFLPVFSSF
jgi:hypothetical protein